MKRMGRPKKTACDCSRPATRRFKNAAICELCYRVETQGFGGGPDGDYAGQINTFAPQIAEWPNFSMSQPIYSRL